MTIHIEDLKFQCIIGILDFERETPQDVILNLTIKYNYIDNQFINYADVVDIIKNDMIEKKYLLIEDALESLKEIIFKKYNTIDFIDIKITKPSILADCKVSVSNLYN